MHLSRQLLIAASITTLAAFSLALSADASAQVAVFKGAVFVDSAGAPVGTTVEAVIGSKVCAQSKTVPSPVDTGTGSVYTLVVPSAPDVPGCGVEGVKVEFRVNGRTAAVSAQWHAVPQPDSSKLPFPDLVPDYPSLDLVVGPPVFVLAGFIKGANPPPNSSIRAFVGNVECGSGEILPREPQGDAWYRIIVKSDAAAKGCAKVGSEIRLAINGQAVPERITADTKARQLDVTLPLRSPASEPPSSEHSSTRVVVIVGAIGAGLALSMAVLAVVRRKRAGEPGA